MIGGRAAAAALSLFALAGAAPAGPAGRPLSIDDVLATTRIDQVALSPDGEWAAVVVQRPAGPGEVYGRTAYEIDPARSDIWIVSRRTGERRNITGGAASAAGFWCAAWSPDGTRLAMLSTKPEGSEPRGGDNVRLYVWERATGALARRGDAAMMTQTRYGSPLYRLDLRGGAGAGTAAHRCSEEETAPFAWLDHRRLLAVTLPAGAVSGLIDQFSRPLRHAAETTRALREGAVPTVTASGSGAERTRADERSASAIIRRVDAGSGAADTIAAVPAYPFRGELTLSLSPDAKRIAILAPTGAIPHTSGERIPHSGDTWGAEKKLGFAALEPGAPLRWAEMPAQGRYPLELFGWSPDGRKVALRARAGGAVKATPLFIASAEDLSVSMPAASLSVGDEAAGTEYPHPLPVHWVDKDRLLAMGVADGANRAGWWLLSPDEKPVDLTAQAPQVPDELRRGMDGRFVGIVGDRLAWLDLDSHRLDPLPARLPARGSILWPSDAGRRASELLVVTPGSDRSRQLHRITLGGDGGRASPAIGLPAGPILDIAADGGAALSREQTPKGQFLRETALRTGARRDLLALDPHLGDVRWGRTMLIDYRSLGGEALKGAAILPPGYRAGRHYPTLVWVYPGYQVRGLDDYWLDPYLPGIYNLQLYAARGYVVLIPSMPLRRGAVRNDSYADVGAGVHPAIDRLVALGIADPDRLGVIGQSFGGYGVYALLTQTRRFKAGVAMAGISDLASFHGQFDPGARSYPGIEQEKSVNWWIAEAGPLGLGVPPQEDQWLYWRNSPLAYADRVETPLLLVHGEYDVRSGLSQAESFFSALHRHGKTARLLRYWGESHSLSQSPANVRDIFTETMAWFDRYLRAPVAAGSGAD